MADIFERARRFAGPYRVVAGKRFRLKDVDPADRGDLTAEDKPRAREALDAGIEALAELQDRLYAQDQWSLLLVFQAIDAAGKDSAIKHVMSGINPQGCQVYSFKAPTSEDLDHDFLWRVPRRCPSAAASASSTARTTRKSLSFACIPSCSNDRKCRANC
jgi:polyphosphate kinase 2 (PPK2 family)